jgi:polyketide synthase PksN
VAPASGLSDEVLCEALATSLAEALFLEREEVELDKPFIDMGLDSIVAAEWVRTLNTRYGITMTVTRVYDYPTIQTLAIFVRGQLEGHAPAAGAVHITLDDVLQQVQQGHLDIAQAYQLLQQLDS